MKENSPNVNTHTLYIDNFKVYVVIKIYFDETKEESK